MDDEPLIVLQAEDRTGREEERRLFKHERGFREDSICCSVLLEVMGCFQELIYTSSMRVNSNGWDGAPTETGLRESLEGRNY